MGLKVALPTVVTSGRKDSQRSDQIAVHDPAVTGEGPNTSAGAGFAAAVEGHVIAAMSRCCAAQDLFHVYWYVDTCNVGVCRSVRRTHKQTKIAPVCAFACCATNLNKYFLSTFAEAFGVQGCAYINRQLRCTRLNWNMRA